LRHAFCTHSSALGMDKRSEAYEELMGHSYQVASKVELGRRALACVRRLTSFLSQHYDQHPRDDECREFMERAIPLLHGNITPMVDLESFVRRQEEAPLRHSKNPIVSFERTAVSDGPTTLLVLLSYGNTRSL